MFKDYNYLELKEAKMYNLTPVRFYYVYLFSNIFMKFCYMYMEPTYFPQNKQNLYI